MASKENCQSGHPAPDVGTQWLASLWVTVLSGPPVAAAFHEPCMWLLLTPFLILTAGSLGPSGLVCVLALAGAIGRLWFRVRIWGRRSIATLQGG